MRLFYILLLSFNFYNVLGTKCLRNQHVSGGACVTCTYPSIRPSGDDTANGDTTCTSVDVSSLPDCGITKPTNGASVTVDLTGNCKTGHTWFDSQNQYGTLIVNGNGHTVFPSGTGHRFIGTDLPPYTSRGGNIIIKLNDLNVDGFEDSQYGGAMRLVDTHLEAKNCQFTRNRGEERGGALRTEEDNVVYFENCEFTGNRIKQDSGLLARGGAISITDSRTRLIVRTSKFADNKREGPAALDDFIDCKDTDHCVIDTITTDVPITTQNIHLKKAMACPASGVDFDIGTQFSNLGTDYNFCKAGQTCLTGWTDYSIVCTACTTCCAHNERVVGNACVACPAGSKRPAGDDPTGADTVCLSVPCGHNERVVNNTCVACAASTFNDAGDDPTGPDTTCLVLAPLTNDDRDYYNPGSCTENERLVNGECADCPLGLSNPFEFMADDTVFYSGKPCANTTDCEQKCTADKSCEGYSYHYGIDNNRVQKSKIGSSEYNIDISGVIDMVGNERAFAVLVDGGGIKAFGSSYDGGNGPAVEITSGAKSIHATKEAFAVLMTNGTIIAWGESAEGGNTTGVDLSSGFVSITSNHYAFAGLKSDGSVVVWGDENYGADTTGVDLSSNVVKIYSQKYAFAALKSDGSVVAWGRDTYGNGPTGIGAGSGVVKIFPNNGASSWEGHRNRNEYAFAALLSNRTVISWGRSDKGGTAPPGLTDVVNIYSTRQAFAALRFDGTVVAWGSSYNGASVPNGLSDVVDIFSTCCAFAALKSDGSVVAWGSSGNGGSDPNINSGVVKIFSNYAAFTALMEDGSVKVWGDSGYGGQDPNIVSGVSNIYTSFGAFAALKTDGSVWTWGDSSYGGINSYESDAQRRLDRGSGISHVYACNYGFAYASLQGFRYGSKSSGFGKSFKLKGDDPSIINPLGYRIDDSVKYGSTACDNSTDCAQKCSADASCKGYTRSGGNLYTWGSFESGGLDPLLSGVTKVYSDYDSRSFHAIMYDGNIKSWGDTVYGGGGTDPNVRNVKYIVSNPSHAMALLEDGTTRSWGSIDTEKIDDLTGVTKIVASWNAFAALKSDGTVVSDGNNYNGGCNSGSYSSYTCKPDDLADVVDIFAHYYGFAALRSNGSLVSWGYKSRGGDTTGVDLSSGVVEVVATDRAWAARKSDGTVVAWGDSTDGGDASGVDLTSVTKIYSNEGAFAALKSDGSVVSWGDSGHGGTDPGITSGVTKIYTNRYAFAALKSDGSVVAWGSSGYGGVSPTGDFTGVVDIIGNDGAFVALKADGSVDAWGSSSYGGTAPTGLGGVTKIVANKGAVAALKSDGTVVTWGTDNYGGCEGTTRTSSYICKSSDLTGITDIYVSKNAFAAITSIQSEYGPLIAGSGDSRIKNADTTCGAGTPVGCAQNERVVSNACVPCPAATTNIAGDNPTGSDTTCDPILCGANLRVVNNDCVSCPPGTSNDAGDDSSGADTTCDPILCGANLRVVNNVCVSCPIGTENAAGDDASGADTTCDPILCGANEYVSSNVCTPCPDTSTKPAGDDASGADTVCACAANEFLNATSQCEGCATGTGGDGSACDKCAENYHVSSNQCVSCPDGTRPAGDDPSGADTVCVCPSDQIMNATSQCDACPIGSGGDGTACDKCDQNYHMSVAYSSSSNKYDGAYCLDDGICNVLCSLDSNCAGYTLNDWKITWGDYYGPVAAVGGGMVYNWGRYTYQAGLDGELSSAKVFTPTKIPGITNAVDVAISTNGGCALLADKTVSCWGQNRWTGNGGTDTTIKPPTVVAGLTDVVKLRGRGNAYCALLSDKNLKCWGYHGYGQFGIGNNNNQHTPVLAFGSNGDIEDFDVASYHMCVIYTGGALKCAGYNYYGQVGMGNSGSSYNTLKSPTQVKKYETGTVVTDAVSIHCAHKHSCYVPTDGKLRCWGDGGYEVGSSGNDPTTKAKLVNPSVENPTWVTLGTKGGCAGVSNGDVYCWGENSGYDDGDRYPKLVFSGITGIVQQYVNMVFVSENGQVRSSGGSGSYGELGQGGTITYKGGWSNNGPVLLPSAGGSYGPLVNGTGNSKQKGAITCAACPSGTTLSVRGDPALGVGSFCTRDTGCDQNEYVNVTHGCQTCADGSFNDLGDTTVSQCDDVYKCLVNEHVKTTFDLDSEKNYTGSSCSSASDCVTKCHGDASCAGYTEGEFTIDMSYHYAGMCVISSSGKARCLGENSNKQLGNAAQGTTDTLTFIDVDDIDGSSDDKFAIAIAGASNGHLALMRDGSLMSWGGSWTGRGSSTYFPDYLQLNNVKITNAIKIAYINHGCAILDTGEMLCWGGNYYGEVDSNRGSNKYGPVTAGGTSTWKMDGSTDEKSVVDVALGDGLTCALMKDGKLRCWGQNQYGQTGQGTANSWDTHPSGNEVIGIDGQTPASTVVKMKNGKFTMCVLLQDGSLKCWGRNNYGQLCDADTSDKTSPVKVFDGESIKDFSVGQRETCILTTAGELKCCGKGYVVAADGVYANSLIMETTPKTISGISNGLAIYSDPNDGQGKMCVLMEDRSMKCWGQNYQGGLGIGTSSPQYTGISNSDVLNLQTYSANYGALVAGSGNSYTKNQACHACEAGYTNAPMDEIALQVDTQCDFTPCLENFAVKSGACTACATGATRVAGDADPLVDTHCICAENQHVSSGFCVACPSGTNPAGDVGPANTYCNCGVNERVTGEACVACTSGATRAAGDDLGAGDTYCTCGVNQHIVSNVCTECPSGSTRAAGDDASGADTVCLIAPCAKDYRVKDNVCVPCPDGMTNDAGDDNANGPNTYCDSSSVCGENEYVSNHVCTTCDAGKEAPYGANPAGPDTECAWGMCPRDYYVSGSNRVCTKCPSGKFNEPKSRQYYVSSYNWNTCNGAEVCYENHNVVSRFTYHPKKQVPHSAGYSNPYPSLTTAINACSHDPNCNGITSSGRSTSSMCTSSCSETTNGDHLDHMMFGRNDATTYSFNDPAAASGYLKGSSGKAVEYNGKYYELWNEKENYGNGNMLRDGGRFLNVFDLENKIVDIIETTGYDSSNEATTEAAVVYDGKMILTGSYKSNEKAVHVLDLNTYTWSLNVASGLDSISIDCNDFQKHTCDVVGQYMYCMGRGFQMHGKIAKLNLNTYVWSEETHGLYYWDFVESGGDGCNSAPNDYLTSTVYNGKIHYVGFGNQDTTKHSVFVYDPATTTFSEYGVKQPGTNFQNGADNNFHGRGAGGYLLGNMWYLFGGQSTMSNSYYKSSGGTYANTYIYAIDLDQMEAYRNLGDIRLSTNNGIWRPKVGYSSNTKKFYVWGGLSYYHSSYSNTGDANIFYQVDIISDKFYLSDGTTTSNSNGYDGWLKAQSGGNGYRACRKCYGDAIIAAGGTVSTNDPLTNCTFTDCAVNQGSSGGRCFDCPTGKVRNPPISPVTDNICTIPPCAADERVIKAYKTTHKFFGGNDCTSVADCEAKCADDSSCEGYSALSAMDYVNGEDLWMPRYDQEGLCRKAITQAECEAYAISKGKNFVLGGTGNTACGCSENGDVYYKEPTPNCEFRTFSNYMVVCYEPPTVKYAGNSCNNFDDCYTKCKADSSCQGISRGVSTGLNYGNYDPYTNPGDCKSLRGSASWSGGSSSIAAFGCVVSSSYFWNADGDPDMTSQCSSHQCGNYITPSAANGAWTYGTATTAAVDLSIVYTPVKYSYGTETTASGIAPSWTSKTNVNAGFKCYACVAPSTNEAGDTDLNGETVCDWGLCGQDQRASNKACVPCDAGSFNFAGDPAAIDSTCDDPDTCEDNEYSSLAGMGYERVGSAYLSSAGYMRDIGMSTDGTKVVVTVYNTDNRISTDGGVTWNTISFDWWGSSRKWQGGAMSADGSVVAFAHQDGPVFVSRDGGSNWQGADGSYSNSLEYYSLGMSADGSIIVGGDTANRIAISTDTGITWSYPINNDFGTNNAKHIAAANHSGNMVIVVAGANAKVMRSTDASTWTESTVSNPAGLAASTLDDWYAATISDDGKYVVIANQKYLYVSSDFGVSFAQDTSIGSAQHYFMDLAMSADGKHVYASMSTDLMFYSDNYGATFRSLGSGRGGRRDPIKLKGDGTLYMGYSYFEKGIPSYGCSACPSSGTRTGTRIATEPFGCTFGTCNANERVVNYACVACDPGTFNDAGDDAGGGNTICDDVEVCPANHYAVGSTCTPCEHGGTNAGGKVDSGLVCVYPDCQTDQYSTGNGQCLTCPVGRFMPTPINPSTAAQCSCVADQYVQGYTADSSKKYAGTSCTDASDCETKCSADSACAGYTIDKQTILATGTSHACAIQNDGSIECWGRGQYNGQQGDGVNADNTVPGPVSVITGATDALTAVQISAGADHTCSVMKDGTLYCWGRNWKGGLGIGSVTDHNTPQVVLQNVKSVACGEFHTCALMNSGSVKCWGYNNYGQLGDGTTTDSQSPIDVSGLTDVVQIFSGPSAKHTCVIKSSGNVWCWGWNKYGQLGDGSPLDAGVPPVQVSGIANAEQVSTGAQHACILLAGGTVKCMGAGSMGRLADGNTGFHNEATPINTQFSNVIEIQCGAYSTCALLGDGTVKCAGRNNYGQLGDGTTTDNGVPQTAIGISSALQLSSGAYFSCVAMSGSFSCWGQNDYYMLGDGTQTSQSTPISPVTMAIAAPLNLQYGTLASGTGDSYTKAGSCQSCLPGFTNAAGDDPNGAGTECDFTPCALNHYVAGTGDSRVCTACTGGTFSAGGLVTECSGTEYCAVNQIVGDGYASNTNKYEGTSCSDSNDCETKCTVDSACAGYTNNGGGVQVWGHSQSGGTDPGLTSGVVTIFSTTRAFAALKSDGSVQAWGDTAYGGNAPSLSNVKTIFSTEQAFAALKTDGSVKAWGDSGWGGSDPGITSGVTDIVSSQKAFAALKTDGSVQVWGPSDYGGTDPGITSGVVTIVSNQRAFAALKSDGSVVAWGNSAFGGTNPGITSGVVTIFSTQRAFAALKGDGSVQVWGDSGYGGTDPGITSGVVTIVSTHAAFAALKDDGSVQVWGNSAYLTAMADPGITSGVVTIFSNYFAFAVLKDDGSVVAWGDSAFGGTDPGITSGVVTIVSTSGAFAALKDDGSVKAWGNTDRGGADPGITSGVTKIFSTDYAFAALKTDGSVQVWGHSDRGGTDPGIGAGSGIIEIFSNGFAFAAITNPSLAYGPLVAGTGDSFGKVKQCVNCPAGQQNALGVATDKSGPYGTCAAAPCTANQYSDGSACHDCPQHTGADSAGLDPTAGVTQCVPTTCGKDQHVENNTCKLCDSKSYRLAGDQVFGGDTHCFCKDHHKVINKACVACEAGSSNPNLCYSGLQDHYCVCHENYHVVSNLCTACPGSATRPAGDYAGNADTHCICGEDQHVVNNACVSCPEGTTRPAGDDSSGPDTPCSCQENEHVKNVTNVLQCTACPTGSVRAAGDLVANGETVCACPENFHVSGGQCVACVAGTRAAGDDPLAGDTHCACNENHHVASNVCTACPSDSTRPAGDDAGGDDTKCACNENFRVSSGSCVACVANTEVAAGGDLGGDDTVCTCKENFYSNGDGTCSACGSGAIIPAGSDPAVASVCTCDAGYELNGASCSACGANEESVAGGACLCKENHHVSSGACTPCAPGSTHPAGDDKSVDTVCTNTLCAENERVQNNVCVPCVTGMVRAAGDDATGANTVCAYQGTDHLVTAVGAYAFRIDTLANNAALTIRVGETHSFVRDTSGDPFRIVTAEDCAGKGCDLGQYTELPTSSLGLDDAEKNVAVTVFAPTLGGTYYYMSTTTPFRKGRIYVKYQFCTITYPVTTLTQGCELSGEETLTGDLTITYSLARLRAQEGDVPQITAADGARHFTVSGGHKLTIENIDLSGGRGAEGGSILVDNGEIDANNVKFTDNVASLQGGAIRVKNAASKVKLSNILFDGNQGTEGGALSLDTLTQKAEIHNSDFKNNRASTGHGGAIKADTEMNITVTNFEDNAANAGEGGAISATKDVTMTGSSLKRNRALKGGAMRASGNKVDMSNMVIEANEAVEEGGAFNAENSEFDVKTSTIMGNKAKRGAAFRSRSTGCTTNCKKLRIRSSSLENNEATTDGGAVDFDGDANAEPQFWVQDSTMTGNTAGGQASDFKKRGSKVKIKAIDSVIGNIDGGAVDATCETGQCDGRAHSTCVAESAGTKCECDGTSRHLDGVECKEHKVCTGLGLDVEIRGPDKTHNRLCGTKDIADITHKLDAKGKELANMIEAKLVSEGVSADEAYALAVEVFGEINKCE